MTAALLAPSRLWAGECLEDLMAQLRRAYDEVSYDEARHIISVGVYGHTIKVPFLEKAQDTLKVGSFSPRIQKEIAVAIRRTHTSKTPEGAREYGFVVITLKGGRQIVSRFTSNEARAIRMQRALDAMGRVLDGKGEVEGIQIFHTHPFEIKDAQLRLSQGDVRAAEAINEQLKKKYGLDRPVVILAIPVKRQDEGIVFSFDTAKLRD